MPDIRVNRAVNTVIFFTTGKCNATEISPAGFTAFHYCNLKIALAASAHFFTMRSL